MVSHISIFHWPRFFRLQLFTRCWNEEVADYWNWLKTKASWTTHPYRYGVIMGEESFRKFNATILTWHYCFLMVHILLCEAGKKITNYTVRHHSTQIKVVENPGKRPHLVYTEDQSKKLIDLKESRAESKNPKLYILHHENLEQPNCCFVRLFKL